MNFLGAKGSWILDLSVCLLDSGELAILLHNLGLSSWHIPSPFNCCSFCVPFPLDL